MIEADLLPPQQEIEAAHALLGDPPSQRKVLEMAVRLSDAGIEPIEIFKRATLEALRAALASDKLPPRRDAKLKGSSGNEFQAAKQWWTHKLTGHPKPSTVVANELNMTYQAINRALKRHRMLAKERALFDLAWNGPDGPDFAMMKAWEDYRDELRKPLTDEIRNVSPEQADLIRIVTKF